jgi:hypothetical protein
VTTSTNDSKSDNSTKADSTTAAAAAASIAASTLQQVFEEALKSAQAAAIQEIHESSPPGEEDESSEFSEAVPVGNAESEEHAKLILIRPATYDSEQVNSLSDRAYSVASEIAEAANAEQQHIKEAQQATRDLEQLDQELTAMENQYSDRAHAEGHATFGTGHHFYAKPHANHAFAMPFPFLPAPLLRPMLRGELPPMPIGAEFEMTINAVPTVAPQQRFSWPVVHGMLNDPITESLASSLQEDEDQERLQQARSAATSSASMPEGLTELVRELVTGRSDEEYAKPARLEVVTVTPVNGGLLIQDRKISGSFSPILMQSDEVVCDGCEFKA